MPRWCSTGSIGKESGSVVAATVLTAWSHPGRVRSEAAFAKRGGQHASDTEPHRATRTHAPSAETTPTFDATCEIDNPSLMTAKTACYLCSATLISPVTGTVKEQLR